MEGGRGRFSYSHYSTLFYSCSDGNTPTETTEIPVDSPPNHPIPIPIPIPITLPASLRSAAAVKIQHAYRCYRIRALLRTIAAVNSDCDQLERLIQSQDTVDAVRSDRRERIRLNEALMALLLRLDAVPGIDPAVRERRRKASRRIVALQEVVDAVAEERIEVADGLPTSWEEIVRGLQRKDREPEGEYFGYRCLERLGLWWGGDGVNMM